jgi:methionyl-tRNA formyltransferase
MGTPEFALPTLKALVEGGHDIIAVYTQPPRPAGRGQKEKPSPVHEYALSRQLPVFIPATLKAEETQQRFRGHNADAAIVAAYGLLLPKAILESTRMGCINVHPSLLPRWRGAAPIQRAVMAGDKETGVVIMKMDAGLDTGDMLMVEREDILPGTTAGILHNILAQRAGPMVLLTLEGLQNGTITPVKQPEAGVTYAKKITKEECRIDWKEPAEAVRNKILGLSPHPGAYFIYRNEAIKILDAETYSLKKMFGNVPPGGVIDDLLTVACGEDGAVGVFTVQRPGKKPMPALEMLKGYAIPQGTLLE